MDLKLERSFSNVTNGSSSYLSLAYLPNDDILASGSNEGTITLWNPQTGKALRTLIGHTNTVRCLVALADGKHLASASSDRSIKIWHVQSGQLVRTLNGHSNWIFALVELNDAKRLASSSWDRTIKIWNEASGSEMLSVDVEEKASSLVVFPGEENVLAAIVESKWVFLLSGNTGEILRRIEADVGGGFYCLGVFTDGNRLAIGQCDGSITIWNRRTGRLLKRLKGDDGNGSEVISLVLADNKDVKGSCLLFSGAWDGEIRIWNVNAERGDEELLGIVKAYENDRVRCLELMRSNNDMLLFSAGDFSGIKMWKLSN